MTDESVPNEPRQTTQPDQPSLSAQSPATAPASNVAPRRKRPLISAIEIENFKGIGAPARIELRPITLLFGQNSAGKSTVLHALCYAHEILSHRNVDVHRTKLGGDRIDLGGFHNFVHGHDATRTVRLRFDLNLEKLRTPRNLYDAIFAGAAADGQIIADILDDVIGAVAEGATSGWLELQVQEREGTPSLVCYEVGVNGALVGRLEPPEQPEADARLWHGPRLTCNVAHPLFEAARRALDGWITKPVGTQVMASPDRETEGERTGFIPRRGSTGASPLPSWDEPLEISGFELKDAEEWALSYLIVGIGAALRDALAGFRYVGPIRNLHRRSDAESVASDPPSWADGSAAWTRLDDGGAGALIDDVSAWLSRRDRLDTGYALHTRSTLRVPVEDAPLLSMMRDYGRLREAWPSAAGGVDLHRWRHEAAVGAVACVDGDEVARHLDSSRLREEFARVTGPEYFDVEVEEALEGVALLDRYEEHLRASISVDALVARIEAQDADGSGAGWTDDDESRLARLIATMDVRKEHRGALQECKAACDKATALVADLDSLVAEASDAERTPEVESRVREGRDMAESIRHDTGRRLQAIARLIDEPSDIEGGFPPLSRAQLVEQQMYVPDMRKLEERVQQAREDYHRLKHLVARIERRAFEATEIQDLASTLAAVPEEREVQLLTVDSELPVRMSDVGVGISQLLPVVVAALDPDRPGITAIEQPELHAHPKLQVELGDLFAHAADDGRVFFLENHSEHLMLRLLRRIEETHSGELPEGKPALRPDQVSVVYLDQVDGEVRATRLRIDETGEFVDRWPHGFFEERDDELF